MAAAVAVLLVGLCTPALLRGSSARGVRPRLIITAQLAGLVLLWGGVIGVVTSAAWPDHRFIELCRAAFTAQSSVLRPLPMAAVVLLTLVLLGRAAIRVVEVVAANRVLRRGLSAPSPDTGIVTASLDTVAYTVGVVRPQVIVDPVQLAQLTGSEQRAVLEHEHGHARGLHGLVDLIAQALAAGMAPWPGARHAHADVRRQLEAAADDRAARRTGRRTVAGAIVAVACSPPPAGALGASGSALWRVDRLLRAPTRDRRGALRALAVLALVVLLVGHWTLHSAYLLSGWRLAILADVCCTM